MSKVKMWDSKGNEYVADIIDGLPVIKFDRDRHKKPWFAGEYCIAFSGDSNKYWFKDDLLHHEDGPAIERANGDKAWWLNGKRHREDGPAREYADGEKQWWLNGERFDSEQDWLDEKVGLGL